MAQEVIMFAVSSSLRRSAEVGFEILFLAFFYVFYFTYTHYISNNASEGVSGITLA